jgi:hypothetical protein
MAVASTVGHRGKGPFAAKGGFELPLTNLAAAAVLGATGPGRVSVDRLLGLRLPRRLARLTLVGGVATAATMIAQRRHGQTGHRRNGQRRRHGAPPTAGAATVQQPSTTTVVPA